MQGAGIHLAAGYLLDLKGNDQYSSYAVAAGCGHDLAAGFLYDRQGNDQYRLFDLGLGAGSVNGFGFCIDLSGNDQYNTEQKKKTPGYCHFRRGFSSPGLFVDHTSDGRAAINRYNGRIQHHITGRGVAGLAFKGTNFKKGTYYQPAAAQTSKQETNLLLRPVFSNIKLTAAHKELYLKAGDRSWKNKAQSKEAVKKLKDNPNLLLNLVFRFFSSHSPALSQYNARYMEMFAPEAVLPALELLKIDQARDKKNYVKNFLRALRQTRAPAFKKHIFKIYEKLTPELRPAVLFPLAQLGGVTRAEWPPVVTYLTNTNLFIRKNSFTAFIPATETDYSFFKKALSADSFPVKDGICLNLIGRHISLSNFTADNFHMRLLKQDFNSFKLPAPVMQGFYQAYKQQWEKNFTEKDK